MNQKRVMNLQIVQSVRHALAVHLVPYVQIATMIYFSNNPNSVWHISNWCHTELFKEI